MRNWKEARKYPLTFSFDEAHEEMLKDLAFKYNLRRSEVVLRLIGKAYIEMENGGKSL